jgi:hypothetical protein
MSDVTFRGTRMAVSGKTGRYVVVFENGATVELQNVMLSTNGGYSFKAITETTSQPNRTEPVSWALTNSAILAVFRISED